MAKAKTTEDGAPWPVYQHDYRFEMGAAHRKPAYEIGAPSISWHTAFWKPGAEKLGPLNQEAGLAEERHAASPDYRSDSFDQSSNWIMRIEMLILHVYDRLRDHRSIHGDIWSKPSLSNLQPVINPTTPGLRLLRRVYQSNRSGATRLYNPSRFLDGSEIPLAGEHENPNDCMTRLETVHIDGVWNSMPLDIRFEVNGEFFTITTTVDFSRMRPQPRGETELRRRRRPGEFEWSFPAYRRTSIALSKVMAQVNRRRKWASELSWKDRDIHASATWSRFLYFRLWENLKADIFYGPPKNDYIAGLGDCFADFRNLTLQCDESGEALVNPWRPEPAVKPKRLVATPWKETSLRKAIFRHSFVLDDIEWVDSIYPVLLSLESDAVNWAPSSPSHNVKAKPTPLAAEPVEYTFTKFCFERCIYGSGFGPQVEDQATDEKKRKKENPLTYILVFGFDEHRQMGRLVHRLNSLGTLRQAALHDLRITKHVYKHLLDDIEEQIRRVQTDISKIFAHTYSEEEGLWERIKASLEPDGLPSFRASMDEISKDLTKVHNLLDWLDGIAIPDGSKHVLSPGWIPLRAWRSKYYRERFDILAKALNSTRIEGFQPYTTFIEHRLFRGFSIFQLVAEAYNQLRRKEGQLRREWMGLKSEHHQNEIEQIQNAAEVLFFVILFPYYASHTLITALGAESEGANWTKQWPNFKWIGERLGIAWLHAEFVSIENLFHIRWLGHGLHAFLNGICGWLKTTFSMSQEAFSITAGCWFLGLFFLVYFRHKTALAFAKDATEQFLGPICWLVRVVRRAFADEK